MSFLYSARCDPTCFAVFNLFLLVWELGLANLVAAQDDVEHTLHGAQQLLVGCCGSTLEVGDDGGCGVALGGEILLGHGAALVVLRLGAGLGDGLADCRAHRLGLDDIVGTVDLCEALAFGRGTLLTCQSMLGLHKVSCGCGSMTSPHGLRRGDTMNEGNGAGDTYSIGCGELLLSRNNASATHGCVEGTLALDDRLAGSSRAATSAGADLGDAVPVVAHFAGDVCISNLREEEVAYGLRWVRAVARAEAEGRSGLYILSSAVCKVSPVAFVRRWVDACGKQMDIVRGDLGCLVPVAEGYVWW